MASAPRNQGPSAPVAAWPRILSPSFSPPTTPAKRSKTMPTLHGESGTGECWPIWMSRSPDPCVNGPPVMRSDPANSKMLWLQRKGSSLLPSGLPPRVLTLTTDRPLHMPANAVADGALEGGATRRSILVGSYPQSGQLICSRSLAGQTAHSSLTANSDYPEQPVPASHAGRSPPAMQVPRSDLICLPLSAASTQPPVPNLPP